MKICHPERRRGVTIHKESCLDSARHDNNEVFLRPLLLTNDKFPMTNDEIPIPNPQFLVIISFFVPPQAEH